MYHDVFARGVKGVTSQHLETCKTQAEKPISTALGDQIYKGKVPFTAHPGHTCFVVDFHNENDSRAVHIAPV
jgi:hypothetical protein